MLQESEIIPYHSSLPPGEKVIVLAPHPDDETLGCGGTIRLLIEAGKSVKVIFLTSGDKADPSDPRAHRPGIITCPDPSHLNKEKSDRAISVGGTADHIADHITEYSLVREKEAEKALGVLGVSDYMFLRFPDREVHDHHKEVLSLLMNIFEEYSPDAVYAPSMVELNPDHRSASALALDMQRAAAPSFSMRVVFYEVVTPLRPNVLVDITSAYKSKIRALNSYGSQLKIMDYAEHITSLNRIRAVTVKGARYVEAFWSVNVPLGDEEIRRWLSYSERG